MLSLSFQLPLGLYHFYLFYPSNLLIDLTVPSLTPLLHPSPDVFLVMMLPDSKICAANVYWCLFYVSLRICSEPDSASKSHRIEARWHVPVGQLLSSWNVEPGQRFSLTLFVVRFYITLYPVLFSPWLCVISLEPVPCKKSRNLQTILWFCH